MVVNCSTCSALRLSFSAILPGFIPEPCRVCMQSIVCCTIALRKLWIPILPTEATSPNPALVSENTYEMSEKIYAACHSKKRFVTVKGAGHGLAYPLDKEGYVNALREFEKECRQ